MMQPIEWHEKCLKNWKLSLSVEKAQEEALKKTISITEREIAFYEDQIRSAKITGKDSFDKYKYKIHLKEKRICK